MSEALQPGRYGEWRDDKWSYDDVMTFTPFFLPHTLCSLPHTPTKLHPPPTTHTLPSPRTHPPTHPEYYLDLISVDLSSPDEERRSKERISQLASAFARKKTGWQERHQQLADQLAQHAHPTTTGSGSGSGSVALTQTHLALPRPAALVRGLLTRLKRTGRSFSVLFRRAWRQVSRDKALMFSRFMSSFFSALLFGAIYHKLGDSASTVPDRWVVLQRFQSISSFLVSLTP